MEKRKLITKEEIIERFTYYDLIPLSKCLKLDNVIEIEVLRLDLTLKNKPTVFSETGIEGRYEGSNFYSLEVIERTRIRVEASADIIMGVLKLKETGYGPKGFRVEEELQYWGKDDTEFYALDFDKEKKEWYIELLEKSNYRPQNWGD